VAARQTPGRSARIPRPRAKRRLKNRRRGRLTLASRSAGRLAEAAGEILDELPGDPARARAAGDRPFIGLGHQLMLRQIEAELRGITADDRVVGLLIDIVEAEP